MSALIEWTERRRPAWQRLENLIATAARGKKLRALSPNDLRELGPLYRRAAADLAFARLKNADPAVVLYLNDLVIRAHGLLYADRGPGWARLARFVRTGFPRLIWKRRGYVLTAAAAFLLGGVFSALMSLANPENLPLFLGDPEQFTNRYRDIQNEFTPADRPFLSAFLMQNNIRVGFVAFALGMLGGFPALLPLFMTGMQVGALAVQQAQTGRALYLWAFVAGHGVFELPAIFIAAGAGMLLGRALIAPGDLSRSDALKIAGQDAVRLVVGATLLFVVAGLIEAFVSPSGMPPSVRFGFSLCAALLFAAYLAQGRRGSERRTDTSVDSENLP